MTVDSRPAKPVLTWQVGGQPIYSITDTTGGLQADHPAALRIGFGPGAYGSNSGTLAFDQVSVIDNDSSGSINTPTPTATPTATSTLTPTPTSTSTPGGVNIVDFAFQPQNVTVNVGDTVTWTNTGGQTHTTTSDDNLWASGPLAFGSQFSFTFTAAGTYAYHSAFTRA